MLQIHSLLVDTGIVQFAWILLGMMACCITLVALFRWRQGKPLLARDDDHLFAALIRANLFVLIVALVVVDGVLILARAGEMLGSDIAGEIMGLAWVMGLTTLVAIGRYPGKLTFADTRTIDAPVQQVWESLRTRETTDYFDPSVVRIQRLDTPEIKTGQVFRFHHGVPGGAPQQNASHPPVIQPTTHHIRHHVIETIEGRLQRSRLMIEDLNGEFSFSDVVSDYEVAFELSPRGTRDQATTITCTHQVTNASVLMVLLFLLVNAPRRTLYHLGRSLVGDATAAKSAGTTAPLSPQSQD